MVRLRAFLKCFDNAKKQSFNSNMVRLRGNMILQLVNIDHRFNSNMVRLREKLTWAGWIEIWFQFQYGAIKSAKPGTQSTGGKSFNSNMVRLRAPELWIYLMSNIVFQFQYGAIKSQLAHYYLKQLYSFNSNMVRLRASVTASVAAGTMFQFQYGAIKRFQLYMRINRGKWVSIPIWCD